MDEDLWLAVVGECAVPRACFDTEAGRDRSRAITEDAVLDAREHLIVSRQVHLDQVADKLQEDRVRRVIEPLLSGGDERPFAVRDLEYVRDLGFIARDDPPHIANPIYAEVVPRELTYATQVGLVHDPAWYADNDGGFDVDKLLAAFQAHFREHSEHWLGRFDYAEVGPQLLLQAFLQQVVNSGGRVEREAGHFVIFDRSEGKRWEEKLFRLEESFRGRVATVWGM